MGKSDDYQFDYLDDNERFADQVNGALFGGRQVVRPEELEPADMQAVYLGKEAGARKSLYRLLRLSYIAVRSMRGMARDACMICWK